MIPMLAEATTRGFGHFYLMIGLYFLAFIYNNYAD